MRILCITSIDHIPGVRNRLEAMGDAVFAPNLPGEQLRSELIRNRSDVIFTNPNMQGFVICEDHLSGTNVRVICTASTGLNHIDMSHCDSAGVRVISITREIDTIKKITSTAELSFAFLLSAVRHLPQAQRGARSGVWSWMPYLGRQVKDLTVGIVGLGRLGQMMAGFCASFGARVKYIDPFVESDKYERVPDLRSLFETCDAVSLHVHVKHDTRGMINEEILKRGKSVVLINTSRGEIVNEQDVEAALIAGFLSHYSTDVLADEFGDVTQSPLLKLPDHLFTVTPHIGGSTVGAQSVAYHRAIDLLVEAV